MCGLVHGAGVAGWPLRRCPHSIHGGPCGTGQGPEGRAGQGAGQLSLPRKTPPDDASWEEAPGES